MAEKFSGPVWGRAYDKWRNLYKAGVVSYGQWQQVKGEEQQEQRAAALGRFLEPNLRKRLGALRRVDRRDRTKEDRERIFYLQRALKILKTGIPSQIMELGKTEIYVKEQTLAMKQLTVTMDTLTQGTKEYVKLQVQYANMLEGLIQRLKGFD